MTWRGHLAWAVLVGAALAWTWRDVGTLGFVYEDPLWVGHAVDGPRWTLISGRPLTVQTWRWVADWPVGWQHGLSLALHGLNGALVWVLARRLTDRAEGGWIAVACFLLLPFQVEAVAYLSARDELLATTGVLLAAVVPIRAWWLVPVALMAAVLAKETAMVGAAIVALRAREGRLWAAWLGVALLVTLGWSLFHYGLSWAWVGWQLVAAGHLLAQVWQAPLLDVNYAAFSTAQAVASVLVVVGLAGLAWWAWTRRPVVAIGLLWLLSVVALLVALVTPGNLLNAHHLYLGMVGVAIAGAALTAREEDLCLP